MAVPGEQGTDNAGAEGPTASALVCGATARPCVPCPRQRSAEQGRGGSTPRPSVRARTSARFREAEDDQRVSRPPRGKGRRKAWVAAFETRNGLYGEGAGNERVASGVREVSTRDPLLKRPPLEASFLCAFMKWLKPLAFPSIDQKRSRGSRKLGAHSLQPFFFQSRNSVGEGYQQEPRLP